MYITVVTSFGVIVAIVGYLTVFIALVLLYYIFNNIPKVYKIELRKKMRKKNRLRNLDSSGDCCADLTGPTSAAISTALHLFFNEQHDNEHMVMTIKKISRRYSPWSSKIYGLNSYYFRSR